MRDFQDFSKSAQSLLKVLFLLEADLQELPSQQLPTKFPKRLPKKRPWESTDQFSEDPPKEHPQQSTDRFLEDYPKIQSTFDSACAEILADQDSYIEQNPDTYAITFIPGATQKFSLQADKLSEEDFRHAIRLAAILLAPAWPYDSGMSPAHNQTKELEEVRKLEEKIRRIYSLFVRFPGPIQKCAHGCVRGLIEAAKMFIGFAWLKFEDGFPEKTEMYAKFAKKLLDEASLSKNEVNEQEAIAINAITADCFHHLSFAALQTKSSNAMVYAGKWQELLKHIPSTSYASTREVTLATAYKWNHMALCYYESDEPEEAIKHWLWSKEAYLSADLALQLRGTWATIVNLALAYVHEGSMEEAVRTLAPLEQKAEDLKNSDQTLISEIGAFWRAKGHIKNAQGNPKESLELHMQARSCFLKSSLPYGHYWYADCYYDTAMDFLQTSKMDSKTPNRDNEKVDSMIVAEQYLRMAIERFSESPCRKAQKARALWQQSRILLNLVSLGSSGDGRNFIDEKKESTYQAMFIRNSIRPHDARQEKHLDDEDWDDLVCFYSR